MHLSVDSEADIVEWPDDAHRSVGSGFSEVTTVEGLDDAAVARRRGTRCRSVQATGSRNAAGTAVGTRWRSVQATVSLHPAVAAVGMPWRSVQAIGSYIADGAAVGCRREVATPDELAAGIRPTATRGTPAGVAEEAVQGHALGASEPEDSQRSVDYMQAEFSEVSEDDSVPRAQRSPSYIQSDDSESCEDDAVRPAIARPPAPRHGVEDTTSSIES